MPMHPKIISLSFYLSGGKSLGDDDTLAALGLQTDGSKIYFKDLGKYLDGIPNFHHEKERTIDL